MKKTILFLILSFCLFSCSKNAGLANRLDGIWSIDLDSLRTSNTDWYEIAGNMFSIEKDYTADLPGLLNVKFKETHSIQWEIRNEESGDYIYFYAPKHPMNGAQNEINQRKHHNRLWQMVARLRLQS